MESWDARSKEQGEYVDFDDLVAGTRRVTVEMHGRTYELEYDPNAYDSRFALEFGKMMRLPEDNLDRYQYADVVIVRLVRSWNLRTRDGIMVPITLENIQRLGMPLRQKMAGAISEDLFGTVAEGPKSDSESSVFSALAPEPASANGAAPTGARPGGSSFIEQPGP